MNIRFCVLREDGDELQLFQEALTQIELADQLGFDWGWEVEHNFLEEYSHSSAPEVFFAACSQRAKQIRLGGVTIQLVSLSGSLLWI